MIRRTPRATLTGTLFPYTPRFRSRVARCLAFRAENREGSESWAGPGGAGPSLRGRSRPIGAGIEATLGPGIACQGNPITGTRSSAIRSEEHTSELQSLMRISYAVFCLKKKIHKQTKHRKYYRR